MPRFRSSPGYAERAPGVLAGRVPPNSTGRGGWRYRMVVRWKVNDPEGGPPVTITTEVRVNWPVPAKRLLDHVTRTAGGDPATVRRREKSHSLSNHAGQGLRTLAGVRWSESPDEGEEDWPAPPALVVLWIDNPYGEVRPPSGRDVQAFEILPAVVAWLDEQGVPRDRWHWEDESAGTFHPGTCDVGLLATPGERSTWTPPGTRSD